MKKPILYITSKVQGKLEQRRYNAIAFIRLFLMTLSHISYTNAKGEVMIKFGNILDLISKQSQLMLIAIAVFPLILPIPYPPGVPSILAIPVFIFIINALAGKKLIKIPKKIYNYSIKMASFKKMFMQSKFVIGILARISKGGRLSFFTKDQMTKVHLTFMLAMAFAVTMPLPGTNYLPAVSIFVIAIGLVLTDGILVMIGYTIGFSGVFVLMLFMIFGKKLVLHFISFVKYLLY